MVAWCGAAFASAYGRLGAWITTGGGHGDYYGNEVYAFELDTLRWVRLNDPYPGGRDSVVDYSEGEYSPGVPLSSHTYQHTQYLPPELGGGPKGSLLLVVSYAAGRLAHGSGRAHACDLSTGRWTRYSINKATESINGTSGTCFDARREAYWRVPFGGGVIEYLSTSDRLFRQLVVGTAGGNNFALNQTCAYDPVRDWLLVLDWRPQYGAKLWALDLAGALARALRASGPSATSTQRRIGPGTGWMLLVTEGASPGTDAQGMGMEWCPPLGCFVGYKGRSVASVYKLIPPLSNPQRTPWRWETETLEGDAPAGRSQGPYMTYSRFRWAGSIRSFVWATDRRLPVQAWRLRGT